MSRDGEVNIAVFVIVLSPCYIGDCICVSLLLLLHCSELLRQLCLILQHLNVLPSLHLLPPHINNDAFSHVLKYTTSQHSCSLVMWPSLVSHIVLHPIHLSVRTSVPYLWRQKSHTNF